ncbi:carboxylesterase 1C-like [Clytia hemisphaerica]|uniref:Carboxylic ester hydrolase n=1 Tax=Clytia hemisphaerica TaxID=252671 RepID=A0A7M5WWA9_9CNID
MNFKRSIFILLLVAIVTSSAKTTKTDSFITTQTPKGAIQGKIHQIIKDDRSPDKVYEYRNIPYAQPPVGNLRWKPPVPAIKWNSVFKYDNKEVWCKQFFHGYELGTEDCLTLTVRQPSKATPNNSLPVLVWIHGGALGYGSNNWYYPDEQCSASLNVVSVSINYRLNLFGFLSIKELWETKPNVAKEYGNFGIIDIIQALRWVQENISSFGGDPKRVTLLGQSAGGAAIYSLIGSPHTSRLFHKAIPASGYPVDAKSDYLRAEKRYGNYLRKDSGCANSTDIMKCLRALPAEQLLRTHPAIRHPIKPSLNPWFFPYNEPADIYPMQVIDKKTIFQPIGLLKKIKDSGIKVLIGNTAHEGHPVAQAETRSGMKRYLKPKIDSFEPGLLPMILSKYQPKNYRKINKTTTPQRVLLSMASDVLLGCQTNEIAANLSRVQGLTVYRYVHSQPFSFNPWDKTEPYAYHGIDTDSLFGFTHALYKPTRMRPKPTTADWKLVSNFRRLIKRFIHDDQGFHDDFHKKTIEIKNGKVTASDQIYHEDKCKLWKDFGFLKRSWGQLNLHKQQPPKKLIHSL